MQARNPLEERIFKALKGNEVKKAIDLLNEPNFDREAYDSEDPRLKFVHAALHYCPNPDILKLIFQDLRFPIDDDYFLKCVDKDKVLSNYKHLRDKAVQERKDKYDKRLTKAQENEESSVAYDAGIVFTNNFDLTFDECLIPDLKDSESNLSIHETQAIVEAIVVNNMQRDGTTDVKLPDIKKVTDLKDCAPPSATNYLLVNVGCVISFDKDAQGKEIKKFISKPLYIDTNKINLPSPDPTHPPEKQDSEDFFVNTFLSYENNFQTIIELFVDSANLKNELREKKLTIYALVFDMHSSQDVCDKCENHLFNFAQNKLVATRLSKMGFTVIQNPDFKVIFRVSSSREPSLSTYRKEPEERPDTKLLARNRTNNKLLNLNTSKMPLILHSDKTSHDRKWYKPTNYTNLSFVLPMYSIFKNYDKKIDQNTKVIKDAGVHNYEYHKDFSTEREKTSPKI